MQFLVKDEERGHTGMFQVISGSEKNIGVITLKKKKEKSLSLENKTGSQSLRLQKNNKPSLILGCGKA